MGCIYGVVGALPVEEARAIAEGMGESMRFRFSAEPETRAVGRLVLGAAGERPGAGQYLVGDNSGGIVAACEGEIYNAGELAAALGALPEGASSDTGFHLIPYLFRKHGKDFARQINGVFTIALWEAATETLHLVRDHVGSHSLYYARVGESTVFATTTRALLASGLVPCKVDPEAPARYFATKALAPPQTMLAGVSALQPAQVLSLKNGTQSEHDYWRLGEIEVDRDLSEAELALRMREIILDAIKIRHDAGGRMGSLLSGGLDTGVVSATLSQQAGAEGLDVFSVVFEEAFFSDAALVEIMLERYALRSHTTTLEPTEFAGIMESAVRHLDSPVNDNAFVGIHKAMGLAKEHGCTAIFEGEGPDEIFPAGNTHGERGLAPLLAVPAWLRRAVFGTIAPSMPVGGSLWNRGMRTFARLGMSEDERRVTWRTFFHGGVLRKLLQRPHWPRQDVYEIQKAWLGTTALTDPLNAYQYGLIKSFLPDDLLYKDERMAAAHGLINRVPLIDFRLVELALRVPSRFQLEKPTAETDGIKLLYKQALRGLIPDEVIDRKKERGFSQPTPLWYRGELKEFVHDLLLSKRTLERGYLAEPFVRRVFDEHVSGRGNIDSALSSIMIFELWMRAYMDGA